MSRFRSGDVKLFIWTASVLLLLLVFAACGGSYGYASRTATEYEQRIIVAKARVAEADQKLVSSLALILSSEYLTLPQAKHILSVSRRHGGPRGARIAALELKRASFSKVEVTPTFIANVAHVVKTYQKDEYQNRQGLSKLQKEYKGKLDSFWLGMWMHASGHPSADVFKPVKQLPARSPVFEGPQPR